MPAPSERPEAPLFSDGLGDRVVAVDGSTGDLLQILRLRPQLLAVPSFEFALRERAARLANFRNAYYARVRRVDRHPGGLAIVSDHVEGTRLSEILRIAAERRLHLDLNAALCLIRQFVPAVALLHENARDVAHGTIAAERLIVTPHGRLVVAEHVLGSAVEQLQFNRERLWQELRVALPSTAGAPRFDHRADVTAMGLIALSLILGRPVRPEEYPQRVTVLLSGAGARSALGEEQPLPTSLRAWVARALQIDPRHGFASAVEAQSAFEEVLTEATGFVAAPIALETFLSRYITALLEPAFVETTAGTPAYVDTSAAAKATADRSVFAEAAFSAEATADRMADKTAATRAFVDTSAFVEALGDTAADRPAPKPAEPSVPADPPARPVLDPAAALRAEFVEALAETDAPKTVRAVSASQTPRTREEKPSSQAIAGRVTAPKSRAAEAAPEPPVVAPPAPSKPVAAEPPKRAAVEPPKRAAVEPRKPAAAEPPKPAVTPASTPVEGAIVKPATPAPIKPIEAPDITELLRSIDSNSAPLTVEPSQTIEERMFESEPETATGGGSRWRRIAIVIVVAIALGEGALLAMRALKKPVGPTDGMLSVQTNPPGVAVFVDGESRGNTPARLSLSAGSHILELRGRGVPRVIPVNVTAGAEVSQYLELPQTPSGGSLLVQSDPPGARVSVDGVEHGVAPVSVADLAPGDHEVVLQSERGAPVRQRVVIQAGVTSSVLAPVAAAQGPVSGWLSVKAPVTMEIKEGGRLIGTTESERLMMSAGKHEVELVNDTLGYRATKVVTVSPGKVAPLAVELPQGTINLNASPWAEVWIDGRRVGETPIGNLAISIGPHEIVFRHPQFGEKKQAVSVTMNAPVRLSIDMK